MSGSNCYSRFAAPTTRESRHDGWHPTKNASDINDVRPVKQRVAGRQAPGCKAQSHAAVKSDSRSRARLSAPQSRSSGVAKQLARDLVL